MDKKIGVYICTGCDIGLQGLTELPVSQRRAVEIRNYDFQLLMIKITQ